MGNAAVQNDFLLTEPKTVAVPAPLLQAFDSINEISYVPEGKVLFTRGECPTGVYLLYSGTVAMTVSSPNGRRLALHTAGPGEILGLGAAVSGRMHEMTAETTSSSRIGFICRSDLLRFLQQQREVSWSLLELLSKDVQACYELLRIVGDRIPRGRG
jgi:CRP-like cAMP-binding protein